MKQIIELNFNLGNLDELEGMNSELVAREVIDGLQKLYPNATINANWNHNTIGACETAEVVRTIGIESDDATVQLAEILESIDVSDAKYYAGIRI